MPDPTCALAMYCRLLFAQILLLPVRAYFCICPTASDCDVFIIPIQTTTAVPSAAIRKMPRPHKPPASPSSPTISWQVFTPTPVPWCIFSPIPASWVVISPSTVPGPTSSGIQAVDPTATATPIPSPTRSDDTTNEYLRAEMIDAIPALWTVVALGLIAFLGWLCWEIRRDVREMTWLEEEEFKRQPLLSDGDVTRWPAGL